MASKIILNDVEKKVVQLLKKTADFIENGHNTNAPIEVRLAGGWVRDKLLGLSSDDLDVTLNKINGIDFAKAILEYVNKLDPKAAVPYKKSIGKLTVNPDQSKHLETATLSLYGLDIDFVGLREETYDDKSRIPTVRQGTIETDTYRRDFTVNSLFFNIRSEQVEDITKRGFADLRNKNLVTPISPVRSFLEDPLRILRGLRFASKFSFSLDPSLHDAIQNLGVQKAFKIKVSRERVGEELEKMLRGPNPDLSLHLIYSSHVSSFMFGPVPEEKREVPKRATESATYLFDYFQENFSRLPSLSDDDRFSIWLFTALLPWAHQSIIQKKKLIHIPAVIAKDNLKLNNHAITQLNMNCLYADVFDTLANDLTKASRCELGNIIRQIGKNWPIVILSSALYSYCKQQDAQLPSVFQRFSDLYKLIYDQNLQKSYELKPLLDGKQIIEQMEIKPGPELKTIMEQMISWQFENPEGTVNDLIAYLRSLKNIIEQK
ncbi:ATP(CTP) tRNA nucleotidyltransferase [Schizosaccharomyces cryophilus OY26]|uniref:ATP(CTP) tRNA nucleotidyltransferase n=1 Tax=Schizosaccharomyces cryophilus (strain OY26 / ATCC MYA-4695 / CBS 11777 / NBRC 106824 / NRRL Y48691) TaxID=653667 RepID=S9X0V0_SCHCR|nr:ATP(CTP) tRNA nucleotidyltransferase [Schizosaccharomyces cryophilus OY26]EPY50617.1 ATP(CTP) tRNA nucleotidyltransferase [Schizosaccharomyces cryophilus OY26]